jgi:hypothetical protein
MYVAFALNSAALTGLVLSRAFAISMEGRTDDSDLDSVIRTISPSYLNAIISLLFITCIRFSPINPDTLANVRAWTKTGLGSTVIMSTVWACGHVLAADPSILVTLLGIGCMGTAAILFKHGPVPKPIEAWKYLVMVILLHSSIFSVARRIAVDSEPLRQVILLLPLLGPAFRSSILFPDGDWTFKTAVTNKAVMSIFVPLLIGMGTLKSADGGLDSSALQCMAHAYLTVLASTSLIPKA